MSIKDGRIEYLQMTKKKLLIGAGAAAAVIVIIALYIFLTVKPDIKMRGTKEMKVQVFDTFDDPGAYASILKKDLTDDIRVESNVNTDKVGLYQVTYSVSYHGRTSHISRSVQVVDTVKPAIFLDGETSLTLSSIDFFDETGFTASDNYDGDLTDSVKVTTKEDKENNKGQIIYTVTDSSGNKAEAVREVTIKDIVKPVITLNGYDYITLAHGAEYMEQGAFAEDDLDGDITEKIITAGSIDTSKSGTQTIAYTVTDKAGNRDTVTRTIHVLEKGARNPNAIYLTFDDGPSDEVTPKILNILKKKNIPATFFILNYSDSDKDTLQEMIADGHTIGIHGYSHDYAEIYKSEEAFMDNITKLGEKLKNDFGYEPFVIRFPGGSSNTISRNYSDGIMSKLVRDVSEAEYVYLDWNVDSEDATGNNVSVSKLVSNIKNGLKENRNNVILMHDTNAKATTAKALKKIIKFAEENGYEFYAFEEDTQPVHHSVNN